MQIVFRMCQKSFSYQRPGRSKKHSALFVLTHKHVFTSCWMKKCFLTAEMLCLETGINLLSLKWCEVTSYTVYSCRSILSSVSTFLYGVHVHWLFFYSDCHRAIALCFRKQSVKSAKAKIKQIAHNQHTKTTMFLPSLKNSKKILLLVLLMLLMSL